MTPTPEQSARLETAQLEHLEEIRTRTVILAERFPEGGAVQDRVFLLEWVDSLTRQLADTEAARVYAAESNRMHTSERNELRRRMVRVEALVPEWLERTSDESYEMLNALRAALSAVTAPETPTLGDGCACGVSATHGPHESELSETPEHAVTCEPFQDCTCGATPEED